MKEQAFIKFPEVYRDLKNRCIPKEYCEKWKCIFVSDFCGQPALAFGYTKNGNIEAYHVKSLDKKYCPSMGPARNCDLYGGHLYGDAKGKTLVITEGHLDCITLDIVCGDNPNLHFTSLLNGTGGVGDLLSIHYSRLSDYDNITLAFDMDEHGQKAVQDFIKGFGKLDQIKIAKMPRKDANATLMTKDPVEIKELKWSIMKAKPYKPPHIVDKKDPARLAKILERPVWGKPWPFKAWTQRTYGRYDGMVYLLAADAGQGKTTIVEAILSSLDSDERAGYFALEEEFERSTQKLLASKVGHNLIRPDIDKWDEDKIKEERDKLLDRMEFFEPNFGFTLDDVTNSMLYMIHVKKVNFIVIDNLTILAQNTKVDGKRLSASDYQDEVAMRIRKIAKETRTSIFVIAHTMGADIKRNIGLATSPIHGDALLNRTKEEWDKIINPPGISWDSGRKPTSSDIRHGSMAMRLADWVWVGWRNKMADNLQERNRLYIRDVKGRNANPNHNGLIMCEWKDDKGVLEEVFEDPVEVEPVDELNNLVIKPSVTGAVGLITNSIPMPQLELRNCDPPSPSDIAESKLPWEK